MATATFPNIDVDSIRVFVTLCETGNLSKTAELNNISIASASRTLNKMRELFEDELFQRYHLGMRPTPRALKLEVGMRRMLHEYEDMLTGHDNFFDPAQETRMFRVGAADKAVFCFLNYGIAEIARQAPAAGVSLLPVQADFAESLRAGDLDLALFPYSKRFEGLHALPLCRDVFVYAVLPDHPLAHVQKHRAITESDIRPYRRIAPSVKPRQPDGMADFCENDSSIPVKAATTACWTSYFLLLPTLLRNSEFIGVMPLQLVYRFQKEGTDLVVLGRDADADIFEPTLMWADRFNHDPAHQWLRSCFVSSIPELPSPEKVPVISCD